MAKEIQSIDRQVSTPNVQVKPNQAYATLGEATSQLGNLITNKLEEQVVHYAGIAGEERALEGTAQKNLLPPLTKATAAYNQAVANTEARQLANQGREMIMQTYTQLSDPATFNAQTPAIFNAKITGITQGILDNTRPENRAIVQADLEQIAANAKVKMLDDSITYDNAQTQAQFNNDLAKAQEQLQEAILTKNADAIAAAKVNIGNVLDDYATINQQIMNKLPEITRKLNEQLKTDQVVADYLEAHAKGNASAQQFITDLATHKIPGLTVAEQLTATAQVLKIHQQNQKLTNAYQSEVFQGMALKINADQIGSIDQIAQEVGGTLDAADVFRLQSAWITHNRAKSKAEAAVGVVLNARKRGPQEVAKLPNKTLNEYYEQMRMEGTAAINASLDPSQEPIQDLSLTQKMKQIVAPVGAPIENFLIELAYGLKSADPAVAYDALQAYKYGWMNRETLGDTLKGLNTEADQIAQFALSRGTGAETSEVQLLAQAQLNVQDKSEATREARAARLQSFYTVGNGIPKIQDFYKQTFGTSPGQSEFDASFGKFQQLFDANFMGASDGDENAAMQTTKAQMRDWDKSKYGPPGLIMDTPVEKAVTFSELGYWLPNQLALNLNDALMNIEAYDKTHPDSKIGIKRPQWMKEQIPTGEISEKDLMENNYISTLREVAPKPGTAGNLFVTEGMLNYEGLNERHFSIIDADGNERDIYLVSTKDTRTSLTGEAVYQWVYYDQFGNSQYLPGTFQPLDVAQFSVESLAVMLPEVYDQMRSEDFDTIAKDYARAEYKNLNDPVGTIDTITNFLGRQFLPGFRTNQDINELIYIQQNKDKVKERFLAREKSAVEAARQRKLDQVKFQDGKVVIPEDEEPDNG